MTGTDRLCGNTVTIVSSQRSEEGGILCVKEEIGKCDMLGLLVDKDDLINYQSLSSIIVDCC